VKGKGKEGKEGMERYFFVEAVEEVGGRVWRKTNINRLNPLVLIL
jgi:hypothetical protein